MIPNRATHHIGLCAKSLVNFRVNEGVIDKQEQTKIFCTIQVVLQGNLPVCITKTSFRVWSHFGSSQTWRYMDANG